MILRKSSVLEFLFRSLLSQRQSSSPMSLFDEEEDDFEIEMDKEKFDRIIVRAEEEKKHLKKKNDDDKRV